MKILIVASWFPTPAAPVNGIFVAEQARALSTRHEVAVLALETSAENSSSTHRVELSGSYHVIRAEIPAGKHVHALRCAWAVAREIRSGGYDLVHAHVTLPGGFAAVLAGMFTGRPAIVTEHMNPFSAFMQTAGDRLKVRFALVRAAAVIPTNHGLEAIWRDYGIRRPMQIVRNNVNTEVFAFSPRRPRSDDLYRLIFVGRLNDGQKNLTALLKALVLLTKRDRERYRLKIIGGGGLQAGYEHLAQELGVLHLCEFAGERGKPYIADALAASDLFVLPSFRENCPCVVAEAQGVGRPVVVTSCGGSEELVTPQTGLVVPVDNHAALADAIQHICHNLDSYRPEEISAYAQSRFGDNVVVEQLTKIYESVVPASAIERPSNPMKVA